MSSLVPCIPSSFDSLINSNALIIDPQPLLQVSRYPCTSRHGICRRHGWWAQFAQIIWKNEIENQFSFSCSSLRRHSAILSRIGRTTSNMPSSRPHCACTSSWRQYSRIRCPAFCANLRSDGPACTISMRLLPPFCSLHSTFSIETTRTNIHS